MSSLNVGAIAMEKCYYWQKKNCDCFNKCRHDFVGVAVKKPVVNNNNRKENQKQVKAVVDNDVA